MKRLKTGDFAVAILIFCLAAGIYIVGRGQAGGTLTAVIRQDGKAVRTIALTGLRQPLEFTLEGDYSNTIVAENGRVRVSSATCPGQDCVHTGWLTRPGQSAVCLENRVSVTVTGTGSSGPDAVAG